MQTQKYIKLGLIAYTVIVFLGLVLAQFSLLGSPKSEVDAATISATGVCSGTNCAIDLQAGQCGVIHRCDQLGSDGTCVEASPQVVADRDSINPQAEANSSCKYVQVDVLVGEGINCSLGHINDGDTSEILGYAVVSPENCDDPGAGDPPPSGGGTLGCNEVCSGSGATCSSEFTCYYGRCRNPNNPEDATCAPPSPEPEIVSCNDRCGVSNDGAQCPAGLTCHNVGWPYTLYRCRLASNTSSDTCQPAVTTTTCGGDCSASNVNCPNDHTCNNGTCVLNACLQGADCTSNLCEVIPETDDPDLNIAKEGQLRTCVEGDNVTIDYTLTVSNPTDSNVTLDSLEDRLPDGVELSAIRNESPSAAFSTNPTRILWDEGYAVPANGQIQFTYDLFLSAQQAAAFEAQGVENIATINYEDETETTTEITPITCDPVNREAGLEKTVDGGGNYKVGDVIDFDVTLTNTGDTVLNDVEFGDTYDQSRLDFLSLRGRKTGSASIELTNRSGVNVNEVSGDIAIDNLASSNLLGVLGVGQQYVLEFRFAARAASDDSCRSGSRRVTVNYAEAVISGERLRDNAAVCIDVRSTDI